MGFSIRQQEACNRRQKVANEAKQIFTSMLEPFKLEECYPGTDIEISPNKWKTVHVIQPHQKKLHEHITPSGKKANRILFSGGVGNGKSHCMASEMFRLLRTYPRIKIVVVTAYDYFIDEFVMPTWYRVLPEDSPHIKSHNRKQRIITLTNGSTIRFKAYDDPDKVRGWDAHVIWIEEAAELGDGNNDKAMLIWQNLCMRLRASRPKYPLLMYVSQNPKGHNWVWKVFIKNEPGVADQPLGDSGIKTVFDTYTDTDKKTRERFYRQWEKLHANGDVFYTISTGTAANAYVPAGYVSSMLAQMADSPGIRARMVEGEFNPINTLVYEPPVYSQKTHCIKYQDFLDYWEIDDIPYWWKIVVGIDCGGSRSPWAIQYYCQTDDGHWIGFDEIYTKGTDWGEIAELIHEKSDRFDNVRYFIDPISGNHRVGVTATTIIEEFGARQIPCQIPRHYTKTAGVMRVHSFMHRDRATPCPYREDVLMEDESGNTYYENGHSQLYYLTGIPHMVSDFNPEGHAMPFNMAEKEVFRYDGTKQRQQSEGEEGLSPYVSEKIMDRDDHAQTSEMFAFIGIAPLQLLSARNQKKTYKDRNAPVQMYGSRSKRRTV